MRRFIYQNNTFNYVRFASTVTKKKTLYLINPALDGQLSTYSNDYAFPPLGIISLGTSVKQKTDWDVKVFDAQITSHAEIVQQMQNEKPDVVGLSVLAETYNNSIFFAEEAKKIGSKTLFGNDQAALMGNNILKKKSCVDYICTAEHGELFIIPFLNHVDGKMEKKDVPFMIYRDGNSIVTTEVQKVKLEGKYKMDHFPVPDRTLLPKHIWDVYLKNYKYTYGHLHPNIINGVTTINRGRGCPRGNGDGRCFYCGIMDLSIKTSSPKHFWDDIQKAHDDIQADIFYEAFDSFSSVPKWIKELIDHRPIHLKDKQFFVYAQAKQVNREVMALYKELGVKMVNIGMDSGDDTMLKRLKGPGDSLAHNKNALKLVKEFGMHSFCSFVLGAPGESEQSLQNTINFIKQGIDEQLFCAVEAQPLMVRVGAKAASWFDNPDRANFETASMGFLITKENMKLLKHVSKEWRTEDIINTPYCSDVYAKVFTHVTYQRMIEASNEIVAYAKDKGLGSGSVGIKQDYVSTVIDYVSIVI